MKTIIRDKEQGAVAPLIAILMIVLSLCIALVVDLGHLHNVKVQLQRAVDAAALAGAQQFSGTIGQGANARAVARATADINKINNITTGWVDDSDFVESFEVELGSWLELADWDPDSSEERFSTTGVDDDTADAIKVSATVNVEFYFYIFGSGTTVSADAIAVNKNEETALPIALLSCVPINEGFGSNVCGVELYKFNNDTDDTAGWTALTYDINAAQLKYFFTEEGNKVVNEVMYGSGDGHGGLENYTVMGGDNTYDPAIPCGDKNVEVDIRCGLGPDFPDVDPLPSTDDPLFGYLQNANKSLPRWDNDAFTRIWSMDGILQQGYVTDETEIEYETRLETLKNGSATGDWTIYDAGYPDPPLPGWAKDGRFDKLIDKEGTNHVALFDEALRYAGYPEVQAKNGEDNSVIQKFIDLSTTESGHFKNSLTKINEPLDATSDADPNNSYGGGESFAVTIPVIFAGVCGEWKSLKGKYYIGTANLLITRIWQNKNTCYDASNPVTIIGTPPSSDTPSCPGGFNPVPILDGDSYSCVTGAGTGAESGIEALITPKGEEGPSGIQKIYLVE